MAARQRRRPIEGEVVEDDQADPVDDEAHAQEGLRATVVDPDVLASKKEEPAGYGRGLFSPSAIGAAPDVDGEYDPPANLLVSGAPHTQRAFLATSNSSAPFKERATLLVAPDQILLQPIA